MKKKYGLRIVNVVKNIFNIRWWVDYDRLKAFTSYLINGIKKTFIPQREARGSTTSFDKTVETMHLTDQELLNRQKGLYRTSIWMCLIALIFFGYMIYQSVMGGYRAVFVSLILMLLALVLAFRYHFWYFQIKERKLGCSFQEWYRRGFWGDKK